MSAIDPPTDAATTRGGSDYLYAFRDGWIKSATDHWQRFDYQYDKRGLQTSWKVTDTSESPQKTREITRTYLPSGALEERVGQKDLGQGVQPEYTYAYEYNRNGLLTLLHDQRKHRRTLFSYDDAGRTTAAPQRVLGRSRSCIS